MIDLPLSSPEDAPNLEEVRAVIRETWEGYRQGMRRLGITLPAALVPQFVALPDLLTVGLLAVVAWGLWPMLRIYRAMHRRTPAVVLWLRRFHRGSQARGLLRFLEVTVGQWGQLVTLADEAVRTPFSGVYLYAVVAVLVSSIIIISLIVRDSIHESTLTLLMLVFMAAAMVAGIVFLSRRLSISVVENGEQIRKLAKQFRLARKDKLRITGASKIVVCPSPNDDVWRLVIKHAVTEVDTVLIDVSELSPNIEWEIQTVLATCPSEKVVLIIREDLLNADGTPPTDLSRRLTTMFAGYRAPSFMPYPMRIPWMVHMSFAPTVFAAREIIGLAVLRRGNGVASQGR
jgi:hypothetical protein